VNRDGRVGKIDIAYTLQNQGVSLTINPVVQANLADASVTNPALRTTTNPVAAFTGTATPGATITYQNTSSPSAPPVATTADNLGNYTVTVPLIRDRTSSRSSRWTHSVKRSSATSRQ